MLRRKASMKTRFRSMKKWIAFLLVSALLISSLSGALAAGQKKTKGTLSGLEADFFSWVYATDTIPEGVETVQPSAQIYLRKNTESTEYLFDCTVAFVSGDAALKDAFIVRKGKNKVEIAVDNDVIRQPGEAVFRITCEGTTLKADVEKTLRVIPYAGNEPVRMLNSSMDYFLHIGEQIKRSRILSDAFMVTYTGVADRLKSENAKDKFQDPDRKMEPTLSGIGSRAFRDGYESVLDSSGKQSGFTAKKYGSSQLTAGFTFANVNCKVPVTLYVLSYHIDGPDIVRPGKTADYRIEDDEPAEGRSFAWRLEGEGAELRGETGTVTVAAGDEYSVLKLIATPSNGDPEIVRKISISDGVLGAYETTGAVVSGFTVRRITEEGFTHGETPEGGYASFRTDRKTKDELFEGIGFSTLRDFKENREDAVAYYDSTPIEGVTIREEADLEIEDHPARYTIYSTTTADGRRDSIGVLRYARHNKLLTITLRSSASAKNSNDPPAVTRSDMVKLASDVSFNESALDIKQSDGVPRITNKKDVHFINAGKKLNLTASFDRADITKNKELNAITWSVINAETGEAQEGVRIAKNGQLATDVSIRSVLKLKVIAASDIFHSRGEYDVTVVPVVKGVVLDAKEIYLYTGSDKEATVKATMNSANSVPPVGLTWTMNKKGIVEMNIVEDGTAVFKAVKAGKIQVTVKELGGKNAIMKINVVDPVTAVTLARGKTKPAPGKTVTVTATIEPKKAGNKKLEWSVDNEAVATINNKGQVKIAKDAEPGTVITVTCKALGAPEPVVAQLQLTVE